MIKKSKGKNYSKLLRIFLCGLCLYAFAGINVEAQEGRKVKVSIEVQNQTLENIFKNLENQSGYHFAFANNVIDGDKTYSLKYSDESIYVVLDFLGGMAGFEYKVSGEKITVRKVSKIPLSGKIVDAETREPLVGVAVMLSGTTTGTVTDINGEFFLDVYPTSTITTSYISYDEQAVRLEGRTKLDIALKPTVNGLSEVVVVGYATQSRKDVTGAVDVINADSFNEGVMSNAEQLFQGKISGVRVINSSGEPGAGVDVMIRGSGSIRSGNTPLFVIDGMPLTNENVSPGGIDEGIGSSRSKNPLNFLNPSDIESVSVLKDASAAAIYGARGSNGVVLITTKKGDKGKSRFTLDSYRGVSKVAKKLDLLTGSEYATVNPDQVYDQGVSTDWQDALFRSAITTSNNIAFSNNTETNHYYMSISHLNQEGIIEENSFERLSGRFNVKQSFFDDDRLTISANITASNTKDVGIPTSDNASATGELITHMLKANPTRPVYDENGDLFDFDTEGSYNPLYMLDFYDDQTQTLRVLGNFELSLKLFKGLVYQLTYGVDRSNSERNTTYYPNTSEIESDGAYYQQNYDMYNYLLEHYMTYHLVKGAHKLTGLGGFSYQRFKRTGTTFGFVGFEDNGVNPAHNPSGGSTQLEGNGFAEINELQSYFGRINYSFRDKYLLTASLRADGSTRFGKNNKYGYFPSFALGWNLSQERFMRSIEAINNMKIRASWGQTGNQEVPNKVTKETYSEQASTGYYMYGEDQAIVNGITFTRTANDDLKWEVVSQLNFGLDYSLFNNKIYGSVDYYNKTTTDAILLIPSTQPNISDVWTNIDGEIVNKGIEFSLGSNLVRKKHFSWTIDFNGATLKNEVKNLPLSEILTGRVSGSGVTGETVNIYKNGYSAGSFYLRQHEGFDANGISIVSDEKRITESALPTFTYGVSSMLNYKNVDLSFSLVGQSGAYLFNNTKLATSVMSNLLASKNVTNDVLNSGQSTNDAIVVSDYYLEKSDYLKLSNLQLGYSFNTEKINWLSEVRVYATGQNLWTWTDYSGFDPSVNTTKNVGGNSSLGMDYASYPSAKTILFGVTIKY